MKKCKHDFKTLQEQIFKTLQEQIIGKVYFDGLLQCKKCFRCFIFGSEGLGKPIYLKQINIKEEQTK